MTSRSTFGFGRAEAGDVALAPGLALLAYASDCEVAVRSVASVVVYEWALFFHLGGALLFFAGLAVAAVGQLSARKRTRPSEVALLLRVARSGVILVGLGTLLVVGFGFWLVDLTVYGLDGWVVAALGLLAFAALAGGLGGQAPKRARRVAERLAREGDEPSADLERLLRSRAADALNGAAAAAAIAILALMVWKPGA